MCAVTGNHHFMQHYIALWTTYAMSQYVAIGYPTLFLFLHYNCTLLHAIPSNCTVLSKVFNARIGVLILGVGFHTYGTRY